MNRISRGESKMYGPQLPISEETHAKKYRTEGESFREAINRVANALKDSDEHFYKLREILLDMRFLPAGRVQAAMGSTREVTAFNCFVSGTIEDNFTGTDGIMERALEAAETMRRGGGIGYDFSAIRPRGETIKTLDSRASGPISFMEVYDAVCGVVRSAGHRRGAQMGVLRIDHPDVEEFIHAKQNSDKLTGFNMSLAVTDTFMYAVDHGTDFDLIWNDRVIKTLNARKLWEQIMRSTWDFAEPGVLFIDRINEMNNLWYCETLAATNPCAEQPLPPYGACLLGSFNLVKYVKNGPTGQRVFDYSQLATDLPIIIRAMDNVIDRTEYPLKQQRLEGESKRRMGIGVTGLANAFEALGFPYGSQDFCTKTSHLLSTIKNLCYYESAMLAKEKGPFPKFEKEKYLQGKFIRGLEPHVLEAIKENGIRNSHLTSIAPTGTISLCADNISSGIEPVFSYEYTRTIMEFEGPRTEKVQDYGLQNFGVKGRVTKDCSIEDHLGVLIVASRQVDSAVSKTCNVNPDMEWDDFKSIYFKAWTGGCKGCTTFNPGGERAGILNSADEGEACFIDPDTGRKTCE